MSAPRIGSLFSGYGGLDLGVAAALGGADVQWHVEWDAAPSRILDHHWPGVPNYGDVSTVDWANVPPVDILTGGFPCQDVSLAGRRAGLTSGTRSGLWSEFARAIDVLRPRMVVIENVRGLLSAAADGAVEPDPWGMGDGSTRPVVNALGAVLGDLAGLGYDARWLGLRAADAGAPHGRFRLFIVASPADASSDRRHGISELDERASTGLEAPHRPHPLGRAPADADGGERHRREREPVRLKVGGVAPAGGRADAAAHTDGGDERRGTAGHLAGAAATHHPEGDQRQRDGDASPHRDAPPAWGKYRDAVERWERVTGRLAPAPTTPDGSGGRHRLSAGFVEWMMGLPAGHVTAAGLSRNEQLKALGNGVVPQQAELAVRTLLSEVPSVPGSS